MPCFCQNLFAEVSKHFCFTFQTALKRCQICFIRLFFSYNRTEKIYLNYHWQKVHSMYLKEAAKESLYFCNFIKYFLDFQHWRKIITNSNAILEKFWPHYVLTQKEIKYLLAYYPCNLCFVVSNIELRGLLVIDCFPCIHFTKKRFMMLRLTTFQST